MDRRQVLILGVASVAACAVAVEPSSADEMSDSNEDVGAEGSSGEGSPDSSAPDETLTEIETERPSGRPAAGYGYEPEVPSLESLSMTPTQAIATDAPQTMSMSIGPENFTRSFAPSSESYSKSIGSRSDAVEKTIADAQSLSDDHSGAYIGSIEALAEASFACVSIGPPTLATGGMVSVGQTAGICITLNGDLFTTVGTSIGLSPIGVQAGHIVNGAAKSFLEGGSWGLVSPGSHGFGSGWGRSVGGQEIARLWGSPELSYSEGIYRGNLPREALNEVQAIDDSIINAIRTFEESLWYMSQDQLSTPIPYPR